MTIERPMFPPRADSVDSFPLQPDIGQPESQTLASESRKPAEGLSRRLVLAGVAAVAALPIASAAPTAADPVFDLIDAHRKTHIAHMAALDLQADLEREGDSRADWVSEKPCHDEADAFAAFIVAPANSPQGLHAKLAYLQQLASEFETEWMIAELIHPLGLIESFAASLENIGVRS
jgi:hypothetical protein